MKDISSKTDNTSSLPAAAFNSMVSEMENAVTDAGFTLDNGSETTADPNPTQISAAIGAAGRDADAFTDSGSANAYTLTKIRGKAETVYRNGARFRFIPANTNTGASTVNIQTIGSKAIRFPDNSALTAGAIQANSTCEIYYDSGADNFKLILPVAAGATNPGLVSTGAQTWTGVKTFATSAKFPSSGATASELNFYAEASLAGQQWIPNGVGSTASGALTILVTRVGRLVTLQIEGASNAQPAGTSTVLAIGSGQIPSWARPAATLVFPTFIVNNGSVVSTPGVCAVLANGDLQLWRDPPQTTFTNAASAGNYNSLIITYSV